jgi:hypothetical protein
MQRVREWVVGATSELAETRAVKPIMRMLQRLLWPFVCRFLLRFDSSPIFFANVSSDYGIDLS